MNPCAVSDLLVFEARPFSLLGTSPYFVKYIIYYSAFSGFVNDFFDGFCWKCGDCIFYGNIRKCNLLKQIIFLRQHPIPMLPLLLFFPFFRPLPLFFFLLFHHPQSPEKRTQHLRALFFQHAALDLHLMVKLVHFQHI